MAEIHDLFVLQAPFTKERQLIFDAFEVWVARMSSMIPTFRLWVDGGFVTHRKWAAPDDIDVMILLKASDLNSLSPNDQIIFESLLTQELGTGVRRQPMGGLVDGFHTVRGNVAQTVYWDTFWSQVHDQNRKELTGVSKGYLEVTV